ncbi:MAG TPA: preprotein translocase subunit SecG [Candidatus Scatomonas merdavium]|nr:preprotein translocase subunit SecG [Candidatus Scatomonas merdavium]
MAVIRTILTLLFLIDCVALIIIVLMQQGKSQGLGALAGEMSETYWGRNKGRSAEGNLKKATRIMAIVFIVLAVVLNMKF